HGAERRRMVFGEVIAVEALGFEQLDELDALLELLRARGAVVVDVIENAEAEHGDPVNARPRVVNRPGTTLRALQRYPWADILRLRGKERGRCISRNRRSFPARRLTEASQTTAAGRYKIPRLFKNRPTGRGALRA